MKKVFMGFCIFVCFMLLGYITTPRKQFELRNIMTIGDMQIKLNPYGYNELAALVEFETFEPAVITMTLKGQNGAQDIVHTFPEEQTHHHLEVLGLYPDYRNKVIFTAKYAHKTEQSVVIIDTPKVQKRNLFVVTQKNDNKTRYHWLSDGMVYDEAGWMRFSFDAKGGMVYWFNHELVVEYRKRGIFRYSPAGELLQRYSYPEGFTSFAHGMGQKPDKNFLVLGSFANTVVNVDGEDQKTHRDFVIELDYYTGNVVNKIDLAELLNPNRSVIVPKGHFDFGMNDWCHINGVDYDETDGGIVVSCRHSGMIKVNEQTHELVWMITPNKGFETSGRAGNGPDIHHKVLTAVDKKGRPYSDEIQKGALALPDFKWPTKNHNARVFGDGIFGIFDNSGPINDETVSTTKHSYASLWQVDKEKHTVRQYWIHPLGVYSETGSSVVYNKEQSDITVFAAQVFDKNQQNMSYADLIRYDFDTHEDLFHAVIYRGGVSWGYLSDEFDFYPKAEENEK